MREPVRGWVRYEVISRAVLLWRLGAGKGRAARLDLAIALGAGMGEASAILACRRMPTAEQRAVLDRVVGVPAEAWDG
jgi:hypothetical protein